MRFDDLLDIEKINNYQDDTSFGILLSQIEKYTKKQISILHSVPKPMPRRQDLLNLYNRALKYKDENALYILENKYDISRMLFNNDGLPEVSDEYVENKINDIESFIKEINPYVVLNKKSYASSYVKYIDYSSDRPCLKGGEYLKDLPRYLLESLVYYFNISNYKKMSDDELIDLICNHKDSKNMMIAFITKRKGIRFPLYVVEYFKSGEYDIGK